MSNQQTKYRDKKVQESDVTACSWDETLVGKIFKMNANGGVDHKMQEINYGETMYVEYEGLGVSEKGPNAGSEMHMVEIGVFEDADGADDRDEDGL